MKQLHRLVAALALTLASHTAATAGPALVVDAYSGQVLKSEDATRPWHPASTTKMMTLYVALKAVRSGRIGLETAIPASPLAARQPRVKVYIRAGQEITLDNALRIMMVKSANDIAYVIAEGVGGSVDSFVAMMNDEASRLGLQESHFVNPNGWHHPDQQTSARDLALLAMALMRDFPQYSDYWSTGAVQLGRSVLKNTNGLVGRYPGVNGFKTGFVCASGFNVVASASRNGRTLIAVVLGALSGAERTVVGAQLLDEGFSSWGGTGMTLASLPSSGRGSASSICAQVRARGGGGALADDTDFDGAISFLPPGGAGVADADPLGRFVQPTQAAARSAGARSASGRITLGPRAEFAPVQVAFGRTSGSDRAPLAANVARSKPETQVARETSDDEPESKTAKTRTASSNGAIPGTAAAFTTASTGAGKPIALQGAVAAGAAAIPLRPGAAAGIRSLAKPEAKPALAKAATTEPAGDKARTTAVKLPPAKAQAEKALPARAAQAKAAQARPPGRDSAKVLPARPKPKATAPKAPPSDD